MWQSGAYLFGQKAGFGVDWDYIDFDSYRPQYGGKRMTGNGVGTYKHPGIVDILGDRPGVWVDDDMTPYQKEWAQKRTEAGIPTLFIQPDPEFGMTREHVDQILDFARALQTDSWLRDTVGIMTTATTTALDHTEDFVRMRTAGYTYREIAEKYEISQERVRQVLAADGRTDKFTRSHARKNRIAEIAEIASWLEEVGPVARNRVLESLRAHRLPTQRDGGRGSAGSPDPDSLARCSAGLLRRCNPGLAPTRVGRTPGDESHVRWTVPCHVRAAPAH